MMQTPKRTRALETLRTAYCLCGLLLASGLGAHALYAQSPDTALLEAARAGDLSRIQQLLTDGADPNAADSNAATALMWAVHSGNLAAARYLIDYGADPRRKGVIWLDMTRTGYSGNLTGVAARKGFLALLRYLIEEVGIPVDDREWSPIDSTETGWTALQWAAGAGHEGVATYLLEKGAAVDARDRGGSTALLIALGSGHEDVAWRLLEAGADPLAESRIGLTALHYAARDDRLVLVRWLLEREVELDASVRGGFTPLMVAAVNNNGAVVWQLYCVGASIAATNALGQTAEALAALQGHEMLSTFLAEPSCEAVPDAIRLQEANALNRRVVALLRGGHYNETILLAQEALRIREEVLGSEHPDVATSLNNLASLLRSQARYAEAEPLYRRALAIQEQALGPDHPDTAGSLNNLSSLLYVQGNYAATQPLIERTLRVHEQVLGPEHPLVGASLSNLAALLETLGDYDDAYSLIEQAIDIFNASPIAHRDWRISAYLLRARLRKRKDQLADVLTSGGKPVELPTVQEDLVPDDGLMLLYQIGYEESFVFVIPPAGQAVEAFPLLLIDSTTASVLGSEVGALTARPLRAVLGGTTGQAGAEGVMTKLGTRSVGCRNVTATTRRLHALWQVLVPDTLWARVQAASEIVVIPDGALHYLPFEALVVAPGSTPAQTRYWLDEGPILRYAPSVTALSTVTQSLKTRPVPRYDKAAVLSLSDPIYKPSEVATELDSLPPHERSEAETMLLTRNSFEDLGGPLERLPGTAEETKAIQQAYGSEAARTVETLQQLAANEPALRAALSDKRYLHLATHGLVNERRGALFASLALTPPPGDSVASDNDGFLQLHEIYRLKLPDTELAVLSACKTGVGRYVEGEGIFALSRGFVAAGSRRVVASQ